MKCFVLLTVLVFASKENDAESVAVNLGEKIMENGVNSIVVKIEEDEYAKNYIGVYYDEDRARWRAKRQSKNKMVYNGSYRNQKIAAHASDTLARKLMANGEQGHKLNFPDDNTEVYPEEKASKSKYFGISYHQKHKIWLAQRWSKTEKKTFFNGTYRDEETAAHASDTLSRKLMVNGEQDHELNFPDDNTEVYPEEKTSKSKYFGVYYFEKLNQWIAQRWSKIEKKQFFNGNYKDEETAARASDTLARKLMANGEENLKLNFPDDNTEVHTKEKTLKSEYFGISYHEKSRCWYVQRWSKVGKKLFTNGTYKDEETAAQASDTLARKLMANGEQNHKLNFPDDNTEVYREEKTSKSKYFGVSYHAKHKIWLAQRWSKNEKKLFSNGAYRDEERAAHASDILARKLMANGEQNHKFNFLDTEKYTQKQHNKRNILKKMEKISRNSKKNKISP